MPEPRIKTKQFIYRNSLKWLGQRRGLVSSLGKPDIEVATPPEFKGHPGIWTPEDLLIASVNSCIMTTFLYYAEKDGLEFLNYESEAEGVLEKIENQFIFSGIKIRAKILVKKDPDVQKAKDLIELSKKVCLISNSVKSKVIVIPEINIEV